MDIDYNKKYKFISDGTWFKKGTECIVEDGNCLWYKGRDGEVTFEEMNRFPQDIYGLFRGIRISAGEGGRPVGEEYEDGELCGLEEFKIIKK